MRSAGPPESRRARPSTVGEVNTTSSGSAAPNARLIRLTRVTASSELPPQAKKSSCAETLSCFITSCHSTATRRSVSSLGATKGRSAAPATTRSETASAWRSILPLAVVGSASSTTTLFGIM